MTEENDFQELDKNRQEVKQTYGLTLEQVKKLSDFQIKQIGQLDNETMEYMLVGYFLTNPNDVNGVLFSPGNASLIADAGIQGSWFTNEALGVIFDDVRTYFKTRRRLPTIDEFGEHILSMGYSGDKAVQYKSVLHKCSGAVMNRRISPPILIKRMTDQHYCKTADEIIKKYVKDRVNPQIGPETATNQFRDACTRKLTRTEGGPIKEFSLTKDFKADVGWMLDVKKHPEKYKGLECGIRYIDEKTTGFHPGHLSVFVGAHGGYKSTVMMNVGAGLWKRGANVLYVSLEMAAQLVKARLWCRMTTELQSQGVPYYRIQRGELVEPDDWNKYDLVRKQLANTTLSDDERRVLKKQEDKLQRALYDKLFPVEKGREDTVLLQEAFDKASKMENEYRFLNIGQSEKIKVSQIERYIEDHSENWKPQVVIVDYLALVASDVAYPDRRDLEVGDVCKALRKMGDRLGFAVITAAQYKRAAIERIRKFGFGEKAEVGTDDLAESNQIGADADTVFMLWRNPNESQLNVLVPKARHAEKNNVDLIKLNVKPEVCLISDDVQDTSEISHNADVAMMVAAEAETPDIARRVAESAGDFFEEGLGGEGPVEAAPEDDGF